MFLVGITGSFLPFLFLLGVVFIFSIQTSAQSLDGAPDFDENSVVSHHIFYSSVDQPDTGTDFHFSQADSGPLNFKKVRRSSMQCMVSFSQEILISGTVLRILGSLELNGQNSICFSGLSPPGYCC